MSGLKKFKPQNGYGFKQMTLWVGVFAAIGVTALILTRAATPTPTENYKVIAPAAFAQTNQITIM